MVEKSFKIVNPTGLDAKISSVLVSKCGKFNCDISLKYSKVTVNLKSIMGVMSLNIHKGEIIVLFFDGSDEADACKEISYVISDIKLAKEF